MLHFLYAAYSDVAHVYTCVLGGYPEWHEIYLKYGITLAPIK